MPGDFRIFGDGSDVTPQEAFEAVAAQVQSANDMLSNIIAAGLTPIAARIDGAKDTLRKAGSSVKRQITKPFRAMTSAVNAAVGDMAMQLANRVGEAKNVVSQANASLVAQQAIRPPQDTEQYVPPSTSIPFNVPRLPVAQAAPQTSAAVESPAQPSPQVVQTTAQPPSGMAPGATSGCTPFEIVSYDSTTGPPNPPAPGYQWVFYGIGNDGIAQWQCTPLPGFGSGGVVLSGVGGGVITPDQCVCNPPGQWIHTFDKTPPVLAPGFEIYGGPFACGYTPVWGGPELPWGWCVGPIGGGGSGGGGGSSGGGTLGGVVGGGGTFGSSGNGGGGPPPPEPKQSAPCELPPDVASWPGQRVVLLPYDLSTEGEKSAESECGRLMLDDALKNVDPVSYYTNLLQSPDPMTAVFGDLTDPELLEEGPE